jgi:hypothetical protein
MIEQILPGKQHPSPTAKAQGILSEASARASVLVLVLRRGHYRKNRSQEPGVRSQESGARSQNIGRRGFSHHPVGMNCLQPSLSRLGHDARPGKSPRGRLRRRFNRPTGLQVGVRPFPALKGWAEGIASRWDAEGIASRWDAEGIASRWDAENDAIHVSRSNALALFTGPGLRPRCSCRNVRSPAFRRPLSFLFPYPLRPLVIGGSAVLVAESKEGELSGPPEGGTPNGRPRVRVSRCNRLRCFARALLDKRRSKDEIRGVLCAGL